MDDRFKDMYSAPIFQRVGRGDEEAPKVDSRFNTATANFELEPGSIDKYGRKVKKKSKKKGKDAAKKSEEAEEDDKAVQRKKGQPQPKQQTPAEERLDYLTRISRGEVSGSSSDDSDSDDGGTEDADSDSDDDKAVAEEEEGEEDEEEDIPMGDATTRIAIQNCDWDSIKATDLLVVLQSFCPQGSVVNKVTVYPSDYGKEMLAKETEYGPQAIWEEEDDEEEDSDSGDDDDDNSEGGDSEGEEGRGNGEVYRKIESVGAGAKGKAGDFKRPQGAVGVVLQQELVRRGKARADDMTDDAEGGDGGGSAQMDPEKLQSYELQKLKYYFAVAECDTCQTANALYGELDGLEFGHSSMVMDLRFVPDDISFKDREKERRSCATEVPGNYTPSDFIVRVLQQTSFDCSWDQGDQERASKLTNLSKWRELNESDFSQYIAGSSDDEDVDDGEGDDDGVGAGGGGAARRKTKANDLRRLLLGGGDDNDGAGSDDGSGAGGTFGDDDFFTHDDDEACEEGEGMVMSFVPKTAKLLDDTDEGKDDTASKKNKKNKKNKDKKNKKSASDDDDKEEECTGPSLHDELGLMFAGEGDSDDDVAADLRGKEASRKAKADKKAKKARGKKRKGEGEGDAAEVGGDSFQLDTSDSRFAALLEGDARFGIDTTSNEFKKTDGMKQILAEQVKRRGSKAARRAGAAAYATGGSYDDAAPRGEVSAMDLVQKLKRKSAKASREVAEG